MNWTPALALLTSSTSAVGSSGACARASIATAKAEATVTATSVLSAIKESPRAGKLLAAAHNMAGEDLHRVTSSRPVTVLAGVTKLGVNCGGSRASAEWRFARAFNP